MGELEPPVDDEKGQLVAAWAALARSGLEVVAAELGLRRRVLIVDDEADGAVLLQRLLTRRGHQVEVVFHGDDVEPIAREFAPHVCIIDLELPGDGYLVAEALRALPTAPRLVAWTGHVTPEHRARAFGAGFDAFLVKPSPLAVLLGEVEDS